MMNGQYSCACCGGGERLPTSRHRALYAAAMPAAIMIARAGPVWAADGKYEAMILACIDPRMHEPVRGFAVTRGLIGEYSQFTIAGAAIGVVDPAFATWHETFWGNLAASIRMHQIETVIAIDHRDCGAAKMAYGDAAVATPEKEDATHRAVFAEFRNQVAARQPQLKVETLLMALDGSFISFA